MPLTPSPIPVKVLEWTQHHVEISRWAEGDRTDPDEAADPNFGNQRAIVINGAPGTGGFYDPDYGLEAVVASELEELIQALQEQVDWLRDNRHSEHDIEAPAEPCDWVVTTVDVSANTRTYGPFIKEAADAWAETQWHTIDTIVTVMVDQLERLPLV